MRWMAACAALGGVLALLASSCDDESAAGDAPQPEGAVSDPVMHDPTQLVAHGGALFVAGSGANNLREGACPLVLLGLGSGDSAWRPLPPIFPQAGPRCGQIGRAGPAWMAGQESTSSDADAPGAWYDPQSRIPDADGRPTQLLALYYSYYWEESDEVGQACIGRVTARLSDGGVFPDDLAWQDDDRPVLCSNTAESELDPETGERYALPGEGRVHDTEEGWINESNEALGLDAEIFAGLDGGLFMVYGSHAPGGIKIVELDPTTGRLPAPAQPGWTPETDDELYPTVATGPDYDRRLDGTLTEREGALHEAPYVFAHDGWYYLFQNWFRCCDSERSTYQIVVGRSRAPQGPFVDRNGQSMAELYPEGGDKPAGTPGGEVFLSADMLGFDTHRGPGHPAVFTYDEGGAPVHVFSFHYYEVGYAGPGDGGRLGLRVMTFVEGWPVVAEPGVPWDPRRYFDAGR